MKFTKEIYVFRNIFLDESSQESYVLNPYVQT